VDESRGDVEGGGFVLSLLCQDSVSVGGRENWGFIHDWEKGPRAQGGGGGGVSLYG